MKDIYGFIAKKEDSTNTLFNDWDLDQLATYVNEYTESKLNNNDVLCDVSESPIQWIKSSKAIPQTGTYYEPQISYIQCATWIGEYVKKYYSR